MSDRMLAFGQGCAMAGTASAILASVPNPASGVLIVTAIVLIGVASVIALLGWLA
jgi:hypothetical protein